MPMPIAQTWGYAPSPSPHLGPPSWATPGGYGFEPPPSPSLHVPYMATPPAARTPAPPLGHAAGHARSPTGMHAQMGLPSRSAHMHAPSSANQSAEALLRELEGPWLPRWQPAPRRAEVDAATDRLRDLEAQILFGRTAARRALHRWACGDDERPMVHRLKTAAAFWSGRELPLAWSLWRAASSASSTRCRKIAQKLREDGARRKRDALLALRFVCLKTVIGRLAGAVETRLARSLEARLAQWRALVEQRRRIQEEMLLKALIFRRWMLMRQTAMLTTLLLRDQMASVEAELAAEPIVPHRRVPLASSMPVQP